MVGPSNKIQFTNTYASTKPLVFELNEDVLDQMLLGKCHVKFDEKGVAFMTSGTNTYKVRHVDNSNIQLIVSSGDKMNGVMCSTPGVVALDQVVLSSLPHEEIDRVMDDCGSNFSNCSSIISEISHKTIWSSSAIQSFLIGSDQYYVSEGVWKRLTSEQYYETLGTILEVCGVIEKSSSNSFNSEEVWFQLNERFRMDDEDDSRAESTVPLHLVQYLMSRLSDTGSEQFYTNKGQRPWPLYIPLSTESIVIFQAQKLLWQTFTDSNRSTHSVPSIKVLSYLIELKQLLTRTVSIDSHWIDTTTLMSNLPKFIDQIAIVDERGSESNSALIYCPVRDLSIQLEERINQLFKIRPVWPKDQFESLLSPIIAQHLKVETILMKSGICRLDTIDDTSEKLFYTKK